MTAKRVLITGASKGIGRAVADRLAVSGDMPVGLARARPDDFRVSSARWTSPTAPPPTRYSSEPCGMGASTPWSTTSASRGSAGSVRSSWMTCSPPTT